MKEALESELGLFPGHAQASVVLQPRDGALDSPTPFVATQSTAVLRDTSVGSVGRDKFHVLQGEFSSKASLSWAWSRMTRSGNWEMSMKPKNSWIRPLHVDWPERCSPPTAVPWRRPKS